MNVLNEKRCKYIKNEFYIFYIVIKQYKTFYYDDTDIYRIIIYRRITKY